MHTVVDTEDEHWLAHSGHYYLYDWFGADR